MQPTSISKITPVLVVHSVEPCAKFWEQQGFTRVAEVPHGESLGFVILTNGTIELMYQSVDSIAADDASMGARVRAGGASLFVEVENLEASALAAGDAEVVLTERTTFYGMRELGVLDPGGNVVVFAQKSA
jgi:uncharacterized glyoxalase superfamily protein PhnB